LVPLDGRAFVPDPTLDETMTEQTLSEKPLNAMIAEALGWRTWEDPRTPGRWFQERESRKPGFIEAMPVVDYINTLKPLQDFEDERAATIHGELTGGSMRGLFNSLTPEQQKAALENKDTDV
jgi:hypothetical protein